MNNSNYLTAYVNHFVETVKQSGVKDVVICPGSRSTPLAYGFAKSEGFEFYRQIDERSAAFFALGIAKAKKSPVVLLCTSGTAAANFFPAIVEAYYARIPLLVITADRPHELREVGAPQAIDQIHLFGKHVKWTVDFPIPEADEESLPFIERHIQRAITTSKAFPMGPVHINVPFREPLLINMEQQQPLTQISQSEVGQLVPSQQFISWYKEQLQKEDKGLFIVGDSLPTTEGFWEFARTVQWPVLADPLSNLRSSVPEDCLHLCIDQYDALLKDNSFKKYAAPNIVIRFGAQPVSKPLTQFLKACKPNVFIAVDESSVFRDSLHIVTQHVQVGAATLWNPIEEKQASTYLKDWSKANDIATKHVQAYLETEEDEGALAATLFEVLSDGDFLFASSSMPIRDVDTFYNKTTKDIQIYANRGTNGIDGVVSTALGVYAATKRPGYLLIGDLAFLHDVNGLIVSRFQKTDLTVVVMNNDGGGIFSYLPQSTETNYFEHLFGTPTGLKFSHIAAMYDAQYDAVHTKEDFHKVLSEQKRKDIRIIEVFTNRQVNTETHRKLWTAISKELDSVWN
ncbi:2-succinyl-5-enolpyruvyl-6-hydroxy-3-cyclohexene-1-carboxylic-acid synthase [Psychrobacillus sp. FJAT-21963]|uniref:2-succinyl-5-enolpyruvyl-6-hydroxy-3- cyclohexene-1-carboxylic-acid synthase n=1 Tax=Psychrobacillus sp. FJAT-21963 TaxID=1712028 RepID=UPI0006FDA9EE|nr:2-succinyl-5-enolpyruvyl-6-hydroxy-3-cyclohexene-1-carboxylic-acid synthase [Psychrobacillus sp. FJAT-21963]KQL32529.1 2-succinyl-5-enolpyruvyl-6-hydroxy-3-cyclohexene-1-carboxylate synthase [Psychrobacillus sp. FJAT-21963]